jgi:tetratricopeptide (TPR) repeat protein
MFLSSFSLLAQSDFEKAEKLFKLEKYAQAKLLFEKVLTDEPNNLKTLEYLGDIQCFSKNWDAAIPYFEKLKNLKPSEANYHYKYGGAMIMKAKEGNKFKALMMMDDIKAAFEKAIALNPRHIEARWALIEIYIQLPALTGGSEKKAVRYSDELLRISPIDGYLSRGRIEEYYERYHNAEKQYKKAIEVGKTKKPYQKLADLYKYKLKQPQKAKEVWEQYEKKEFSRMP